MIFYIFPYLIILLFSFYLRGLKANKRISVVIILLILLPAILIFLLRGDVGTDTFNYLEYYRLKASEATGVKEFEPGFEFLSSFFITIGISERSFVNSIALITTLFIAFSFSGVKDKVILFFLVFFPLFFYDFTMNGLRYGLGFSIAAIAIDNYYKKNKLWFTFFSLSAVLVQYSSFLLILVFLLEKLKTKYLIVLALSLVTILALFWNYFEILFLYLTLKQEAYKEVAAPGITSGIAPLFIFLILGLSFIKNVPKDSNLKGIYILFFFEFFSFLISKISYAGLRFQSLFLFALVIYLKNNFYLIQNKNKYFKVMIFISFIAFFIFLKNVNTDVEDNQSPFLPYKFFWE